jgi:hypothetical protein
MYISVYVHMWWCTLLCMYVCMWYVLMQIFSYVCMYVYAYTFVIYILCAESVTEAKKYRRTTCSRGQHTYVILRMCRVEILAHILITWYLFCHFCYSLEECSGIVPETKPPPLLCTSFTICYSLQLGHQKLARIVPSPFRQANTTHTTPRALHRLHYLKLTVPTFSLPLYFSIDCQCRQTGICKVRNQATASPPLVVILSLTRGQLPGHLKIHSHDLRTQRYARWRSKIYRLSLFITVNLDSLMAKAICPYQMV